MTFVAGVLTAPTVIGTTSFSNGTFTAATGATGSVTNQVQISLHSAGSYSSVAGATASPFASGAALLPGVQYDLRVAYTDSSGPTTVNSNVVTITMASSTALPALGATLSPGYTRTYTVAPDPNASTYTIFKNGSSLASGLTSPTYTAQVGHGDNLYMTSQNANGTTVTTYEKVYITQTTPTV